METQTQSVLRYKVSVSQQKYLFPASIDTHSHLSHPVFPFGQHSAPVASRHR